MTDCHGLRRRLGQFVETATSTVCGIMFVFEMPKVVHIRNIWLAVFFRAVQLFILIYFTLYVMWWNRGYQSFERAVSGVMARVNSITWLESQYWRGYMKPQFYLFDNGEYNLHSIQKSGFYLVTRIHTLKIQTMGYCPETSNLPDANCYLDKHCPVGASAGSSVTYFTGAVSTNEEIDLNEDGHGVFTGRCINETHTCEVYGWCPIDANVGRIEPTLHFRDTEPQMLNPPNILAEPYSLFTDLQFLEDRRRITGLDPHQASPFYDILNATIFIKNAIEFPYFEVKRRNILPWMPEEYVTRCVYNPTDPRDRYCPVFRVGKILEMAGVSAHRLLHFGGVVAITIEWECNFDWSVNYCLPEYNFRQLDGPPNSESKLAQILAEGSTQEIVVHLQNNHNDFATRQRFLMKTTGIMFLIRVSGRAGKFNLLLFTMKLGSGLALLGGATIVCDLIMFHMLHDRKHYKEATHDDKTLRRLLSMTSATRMARVQRARWLSRTGRPEGSPVVEGSNTQTALSHPELSLGTTSCHTIVSTKYNNTMDGRTGTSGLCSK